MSQQIQINYGAAPNDGTGDPLRTAFIKTDENFDNIWLAGPVGSNVTIVNNTISVTDTNGNLVLSPNGIGTIQTNSRLAPLANLTYDIGSSALRYRNIYAAGVTAANAVLGNLSNITVTVANLHVLGGTAGYVLQTDGAGNLTWAASTGAPSGVNTQVQFNNAGSFGAQTGFTFNKTSNLLSVPGNITTTGNVTGNYFLGNGSQLTGIAVTYGNSNVTTLLASLGSNIISGTGNITTTGNITGNYFLGNGSQLTGIVSSYGNANVVANLAALGTNPISTAGNITTTANVSGSYILGSGSQLTNLPAPVVTQDITSNGAMSIMTYDGTIKYVSYATVEPSSGNISAGNVLTTGNVSGNYFIGNGSQLTGISSAGTGNVTFNDINIIGTGNLRLQPDPANSSAYLDIYLTTGPDIHIAGNGETVILGTDDFANITVNVDGNVSIQASNGTPHTWTFDTAGNLTLPGNIIAINYLDGNRVIGDVTFSGEAVIGTGTSNTQSGLYLSPDPVSLANDLYLRVRGNIYDEPTHIHFDTGNNAYYNQFIGDDNKYIQLANTGNIVINTSDYVGNTAQWTFGTTGVLTLPNADASGFGNIYFEQNSSTITFGLDDNAVPFLYSFATSGITLPRGGATIRDTVGNALAFGRDAAATGPQGNAAVAIGQQAGETSQGQYSVAVGYQAGLNTQGASAVAIGVYAGTAGQGQDSVAIGTAAGKTTQGIYAVALGYQAGNTTQGNSAVAIGENAGYNTQGDSAVAIGDGAGQNTQGQYAVALGYGAGDTNQGNNSIIINATNGVLNQTTANTFTVAPVRNDVANIGEVLFYNTTSKEITYGNTISVAGNITGNYLFGNGSQLTGVGAASVPSQTILPTIQTISINSTSTGGSGGGSGWANVTVANTIPVTEYGVIVTSGTISQTYVTGALGSIPGSIQINITTGLNVTPFTVYAYVTSNAGTYYSNSATGTSGICLLAGTQIALSDGTYKAIEDITYTDKMLSRDFDRGCYAETTALWIKRSETGSQYNLLTFSDGTTLRTFDQHRIFNKQAGAFTYPMTAATPIGTVTVNEHGQEITLTNKQVIVDTIEYYNVITDYHMNLFSDSVLTSCRFNNIYPITDMKFVKDGRTLRTRAEFENVPDRFFYGLRLAEQTTDIKTVEWYVNRLLSTEMSTQSELTF